jgi:cyclopropane fatty-acyl-phospholipid synthase-like methyltransferase
MAQKIPERLMWAVQTLNVQPHDRLLEIGCGTGVTLALICDQLDGGSITGLDRSDKAITTAHKRSVDCIAANKARLITGDVAQADLGSAVFDKIFAVNVNIFWLKPIQELKVIKAHLAPQGSLYLFFEPPDAAQAREIAAKLHANLAVGGFANVETIYKDLNGAAGVAVIARTT